MIDTNPTHYELYVAKKNGQPKLDYPSFEMNQSVSKTMNHQFSLVHTVFPDQPPNKKTLPKVSSFNDPSIKANPKRKYTDSPNRADLKTNYVNSLADLDDFKLKKKTLSKEIDPPVTNKKTNWFLSLIGCACSSSKNE
jgi:hypothetical protein